jgi:hypothetical protein
MLDPEVFVAALSAFIPAIDRGSVRIVYVRYKPGKSCIVAYHVGVAGTEVRLYAKAHPASHRSPPSPRSLGLKRIVLQQGAITVSSFPTDGKLKAVSELAEPEGRGRVLREVVPDRPELWHGIIRELRYMPERRYVAQLLAGGAVQAVVKVYIEREYETVRRARAFASRELLRIARCLGCSDVYRVVSHEWLPGRLLSESVLDPELDLGAMVRTGAALAELHGQRVTGLNRLTRRMEGITLLSLAANLGFVLPNLRGRFDGLARRLASSLAAEAPVYRPIHGDFYPRQVLLDEGAVALLDLDRAAYGDPAADLGLFVAHLEREALRGTLTAGRVDVLREAFLEGYRDASGRPIPPRLDLYTAVGLLRLTPDPFRFREASWPERTEAILDRSETILQRPRRVTAGEATGPAPPGPWDG